MSDKELLRKFGIKNLNEVPHIKDRVATEKDLKQGRAIFYLTQKDEINISRHAKIKIPSFAYQKKFLFKKPVIIIQAEETKQGIVLGLSTRIILQVSVCSMKLK